MGLYFSSQYSFCTVISYAILATPPLGRGLEKPGPGLQRGSAWLRGAALASARCPPGEQPRESTDKGGAWFHT